MRNITCELIVAFLILFGTPALAAPTVLVQLGSAPLLGRSNSAQDLRLKMITHDARLSTAATMLGLSPSEYRVFRSSLAANTPAWGVLPRHLEVMAFYRPDGVRVLRDVIIPAQTYGWEVDVDEPGQTVRVLIPATCGNLSILHRYHPAVAARVAPPATRVASSAERALPQPSAAPTAEAVPLPSPSPSPEIIPTASPSPAVVAITPPQATASHKLRWPWLIPIALLFFHGGSGASSHPVPGNGGGCGCGCQQ